MKMKLFTIVSIFTLSISFFLSSQELDMRKFKSMEPRSIGPAGMSGRVTSIRCSIKIA